MGLRDQFKARQLPRATVRLRMDFSPESDAAVAELATAEAELASAKARGFADLAALERRVAAAQVAADGFHADIVVAALPPAEMDDLVAAHPATAEQLEKTPQAVWNPDTFAPALLAGCVDSDMTETDWAELTTKGPVTTGEVRWLFQAALDVNDRSPEERTGKG